MATEVIMYDDDAGGSVSVQKHLELYSATMLMCSTTIHPSNVSFPLFPFFKTAI